ncbi:hypothetical protein BDQ17DRAFT_218863 [Cyathus striatus]|nr:hypothetical protein BDQ17DRAFT_218863 [Cyathus striatus]
MCTIQYHPYYFHRSYNILIMELTYNNKSILPFPLLFALFGGVPGYNIALLSYCFYSIYLFYKLTKKDTGSTAVLKFVAIVWVIVSMTFKVDIDFFSRYVRTLEEGDPESLFVFRGIGPSAERELWGVFRSLSWSVDSIVAVRSIGISSTKSFCIQN